ncbi:hypothetical protein BDV18DRAFT_139069 [Aspergillus unguis]
MPLMHSHTYIVCLTSDSTALFWFGLVFLFFPPYHFIVSCLLIPRRFRFLSIS